MMPSHAKGIYIELTANDVRSLHLEMCGLLREVGV
jgi:hypothetical protein